MDFEEVVINKLIRKSLFVEHVMHMMHERVRYEGQHVTCKCVTHCAPVLCVNQAFLRLVPSMATPGEAQSHSPCLPSEITSCSPFWTTVTFPRAWLSLSTAPRRSLPSTGSLSYNAGPQRKLSKTLKKSPQTWITTNTLPHPSSISDSHI